MYSNHRTCISVPHFVGVFVYAGTINRPLQLLVVCHFVANGLLIMQRSPTKLVANTPPGVGDRFIAPVSLHYQIRIFTSSNTCFRFNAHAYPHYQLRVFTLLNTYIHFTEYVHLHYRTRISTLPNTCICIIKYTFPHHRTHISATLFVGEYGYAGTINRTFAAANGWQHATSPLLYYNKLSP